jgi:hypothetical protein
VIGSGFDLDETVGVYLPGLLNRSMNWLTVPSGITETCVGMRTLKFDPLFRTAMRGFHCGQKLTLHKQAGYICADRLFQSQRICL